MREVEKIQLAHEDAMNRPELVHNGRRMVEPFMEAAYRAGEVPLFASQANPKRIDWWRDFR